MGERRSALKLFERAYACQRSGELEDAIRLYQASIAEYPTAEAHTFLGWVYGMQKRYAEAITECKRAIAVDPAFGNPYNDIGAYLVELGRKDEAIPWFKRATEAPRYDAPQFPHMNLARIYESRGQLLEALAELSQAAEKRPEDPQLVTAIRRLQARVN
ncbi:MAG: tetratricopeptide repeat protein [Gemmatimonadales bacterium]|nr:tetratricopeptide repeat protein [Gemmatimonadales bacterium]NIN10639.1 tetratricopeptide repeat protein [Gemmatimonadales bacterium]NIN49401.1 tetratricopeptide repeat protein [Gemmatimonadales bacterium]NIP06865.1 tetratricopeptide repeat protein [Gemmatimonadales bacterium]NIR01539.1 tetratricopeptide repeat protein [Gemmatimonadales bacterium]